MLGSRLAVFDDKPRPPEGVGARPIVLCVDDEPHNLDLLDRALRRHFQRGRYEPAYSFTAWHGANLATAKMVGLVHGCLGWTRKLRQANEGEIVWIAVAEEARGQGIGQALLVKAMHALREGGAETISVSADNHAGRPQLGLYTKSGFTVRKAIIDYQRQI